MRSVLERFPAVGHGRRLPVDEPTRLRLASSPNKNVASEIEITLSSQRKSIALAKQGLLSSQAWSMKLVIALDLVPRERTLGQ